MANKLYVAGTEVRTGKSAIILGLMELLTRNIKKVAFFRPLIEDCPNKGRDNTINLVKSQYNLCFKYEEMYAYSVSEASQLIALGKYEEMQEGILAKFNNLAERADFVLCEGAELEGATASFDFDINVDISNNLGAPVLLVAGGRGKTIDELVRSIKLYYESLSERSCDIVGTIVNRVYPTAVEKVRTQLLKDDIVGKKLVYIIANDENLGNPSVGEVARLLNAEILYGENSLTRHVRSFTIAAMQLRNLLERIDYGTLIITPGDRSDVILACLAAVESMTMPNISGIMLTGGLVPEGSVQKVIEGFRDSVPIIAVNENTFESAIRVDNIHAAITPDNTRKITQALAVFERHIDMDELSDKIIKSKSTIVTPKMFESQLLQRAKMDKQHIVLPEGETDRVLKAAEILLRREVVNLTILGRKEKIYDRISSLALHLEKAMIIDPRQSEYLDDYSETYYQLRKDKGVTRDVARDLMVDLNYFGTMMIYKGHADGMVSGAAHTTADTIRPAFQFIKTKPGCSVVSSVFLMCLNDRVLAYGDCAINPDPTAEQLAEIALSSAKTAVLFGIKPLVAMLSYSSGHSGKGQQVEKVRLATQIAREKAKAIGSFPGLEIEGPIQYDAAVDMEVARTKMPDSKVAGRATVFVFPDLNTGNNTYKAVQRSAGAVAVGPVLQGLRRPVNDLSRGCLVADIVNTVAITAVQAQAEKKEALESLK
ncbi:phosphate acetyltransferase [Desulforhopalus singaporensis]|uniref:Phosphate acetyltransferase n=1 Tax=Desulforhopalus singaporensis TaxID=91360 RepID=A0A1H0V334_9BACT|nr:phosphate acetyltransferase [Desulforhopalus singaporensis]SDP72857.1 phosphotransacetylase [Desulforhopalus singaporensis]